MSDMEEFLDPERIKPEDHPLCKEVYPKIKEEWLKLVEHQKMFTMQCNALSEEEKVLIWIISQMDSPFELMGFLCEKVDIPYEKVMEYLGSPYKKNFFKS